MIRPPVPDDKAYITATWGRSLSSTHAMQRHAGARTRGQINALIDRALLHPDTRALVAACDEDPLVITGWVVYGHCAGVPVVHYLYTRDHDADHQPLRGQGIAGSLLASIRVDRQRAVICTSDGPSSEAMRARFKASSYYPLADFLPPEVKR